LACSANQLCTSVTLGPEPLRSLPRSVRNRVPSRLTAKLGRNPSNGAVTAAATATGSAHTSTFNGKIDWVRIDLGEDAKDADHYIEPDERFRIAMARQ